MPKTALSSAEKIEKFKEKVKDLRICMFHTVSEDGLIHARPMATQELRDDGVLWFMTSVDTQKIKEIKKNPSVAISYGDNGAKYISVSGKASVIQDKAKVEEFWNDFYKAWFTGKDDPSIRLIKVEMQRAEYWDHPGGTLGNYLEMAAQALTGSKESVDEHEVISC